MNALIDIGIDYGQGYFIQKPSELLPTIDKNLIQLILARNIKKKELYINKSATVLVGDICRKSMSIESTFTGVGVLEAFNENPALLGLPVVDGRKLSGLIMKDKFFAKLGTQFGYALYINRPVSILMDNRPLSVEYETALDIVSKKAVTRNEESLYDYIVVTRDSDYFGIVTVKDLLEKTTELEVTYARHLNPLSGLPGNLLIEQKLCSYVGKTSPFTILYVDINDFKVYNDVYGFENGDRMLQYLASILKAAILDCPYSNFTGHIGGDDFILLVESYDVEDICRKIISAFDDGISSFYSDNDIVRSFIISKNRRGVDEKFGLAGLSISGITNKDKTFNNIYQLSEYSSKMKKLCKEKCCSCYLIE